MMGQQKSERELFSYAVNLEKRVRSDHPLRAVAAAIDFRFVREEVARCYGRKGNVSVDPEVILKMMFLLFFDDVASERELMKVIAERLDYLWFLGYGLEDEIPDHSVLSKARRRWGKEVFERLFVQSIGQCVRAGLVDGRKLLKRVRGRSLGWIVLIAPRFVKQLGKICPGPHREAIGHSFEGQSSFRAQPQRDPDFFRPAFSPLTQLGLAPTHFFQHPRDDPLSFHFGRFDPLSRMVILAKSSLHAVHKPSQKRLSAQTPTVAHRRIACARAVYFLAFRFHAPRKLHPCATIVATHTVLSQEPIRPQPRGTPTCRS
jgi:transposase